MMASVLAAVLATVTGEAVVPANRPSGEAAAAQRALILMEALP